MTAGKVKKAVFPVAGLGTRFLPATKAMPKEMLTVVDRPLIQHVVDEALEAGIEHLVFVTGRNKGVIEDYFDIQYELEATLKARNKKTELNVLSSILPKAGSTSFTRQQEPLGLGHAVWCARDIVGNEPFAVLLPDVLVKNKPSGLKQMIDAASATQLTKPLSPSTAWSRNPRRAPRRPTFRLPAATSCSRRYSRFWRPRSAARVAKSSSPMR